MVSGAESHSVLRRRGVVAILARNEEKNRAVVDELTKAGVPALAIRLDVIKRADWLSDEKVERKLRPISVLSTTPASHVRSALKFRAEIGIA